MSHQTGELLSVLHVVPGLMPGGMELTMARVIRGLAGDGLRHSVVCLKGDVEIADRLPAGTEVHCLHSRPNEVRLPGRLAKLIRRLRPDVVHARNWGAWPDVSIARLLTLPVVPLVLSFHGLGRAGYEPRRRRWASWFLARAATHLMTVSNESRRMLAERWGWLAERTEVIPNGVDTDLFRPAERFRRGNRLVVGSVGNLRPVKNHALLVRAAAAVAANGVDIEVRIAGEGDQRASLTQLARSLGPGDRLKLPGHIADVPAFLQALDIFVLSSDSEQHPNSLNEAMACGLPCIATRVGAVAELLDEGRCGIIIAAGDEPALVMGLRDLAGDAVRRASLGAAARQRAYSEYSLTRMIEAYRQMYLRLSSRSGSRR